jgi:CTP:molybdopterin cytidylyltransferase MocA
VNGNERNENPGFSKIVVGELPKRRSKLVEDLDAVLRGVVVRIDEGQHPMRVRNALVRDHAAAICAATGKPVVEAETGQRMAELVGHDQFLIEVRPAKGKRRHYGPFGSSKEAVEYGRGLLAGGETMKVRKVYVPWPGAS